MKKLFLIPLLLIAFCQAQTTHYVDPLGSDAAAGTIGAPWHSLYKAVTTATTFGDIIHLNSGSYTEANACPLAPGVNLEGDGKGVSIVHATNVTDFGYCLLLYSAPGTNGSQYIKDIGFVSTRNTSGTDIAIRVNGRSNVTVHHCDFASFRYSAASFNGRDENTGGAGVIGDPFILPVGNEYATGNSFHHNTTSDCSTYKHVLHDGSTFGYFGSGHVVVGSQSGFVMYNNDMVQDNGTNGDNGWLVKIGNSGFIKNCRFHHNSWTKNKFIGDYQGDNDFPFSFEMWNSRGNNQIDSNTVKGGGIDMAYSRRDTGTYSWKIFGNNFYLPELNNKNAVALLFETGCDGALIQNNRISKFYNGIIISVEYFADNADHNNKINDITIQGNLFDSVGAADPSTGDESITYNGGNSNAIYMGGQATLNTDSFTRILVDHNTFHGAPNHKPYSLINANNNDNMAVKHDWVFSNNIFYNANDYHITTGNDIGTPITGYQYLNNTTYNNGHSNAADYGSPAPTSPVISGTLTSDPLLQSDYTLGMGSTSAGTATNGTNRGHTGTADTTAPTVIATNPANSSTGIALGASFTVTWDGPMDAAYLTGANLYITYSGGTVPATVTPGLDYAIITPLVRYAASTLFTFHSQNVKDAAGNTQASPYTSTFTTSIDDRIKKTLR